MRQMENNKLRTRMSALILVLTMVISLFEGMSAVKVEAASLLEPDISDPVYIGEGRLEGANTSKNLAVGNDGAIYAVYQGTGASNNGAVCIRKSVDNGKSFGDEVIVAPDGTECEVAVSSTNRVFVSYHVQTGMSEGSMAMPIFDTYVAYSDDLENEDFISVKVPEVGVQVSVGQRLNEATQEWEFEYATQYPNRHHIAVNGDYVYLIASNGVNLFISNDGGDTYTKNTISEQAMAYTIPMVDKDTGAIMLLRDDPRVDYYYNTNADGSGDFTYYKYWALDFEMKEQGVCDVYYSTADYGKYNGKGYLYTSGAFGYIYRIEVGQEMSDSSWTKNSSINPNNVVEYPCATFDEVHAPDPVTKEQNNEKEAAYFQIFNGRSVTADYKGNVAVGYVMYSTASGTGKAYYQVSHDGGTTFGAGVEVANATAANAAINPIVGSLLYMYEANNKVYLVTVDNVLENYSVTANPTTLVFSPEDAGGGTPRKFLITNNTDDELPVPQVIASEGFEVTVGDDSVPAHGTLEVSVVYKDPTVKNGTVTVKYEDAGGNPQELKVQVALSNTIKSADAANAAASTTSITVEDIDSETYYALFTTEGGEADEMIRGWISGAITPEDAAALEDVELSGTKLIFTGLDPDTAYVVRTVSKEAYEATEYDNPDYYEDAKVMTAIDTMGKVEGSTYTPVITPGETTITVTGLDPQYTYGLYDSKGKDIATGGSFRAPSGGKVEFTGLTSGTTYYLAAKSADNSECDKIKTRTLSSATPSPSPSPTPTPTTHEHDIEYTVEGMTIKARCVTEEPDTCEYYETSTDVNIVFDKEADVSEGDYVKVTTTCADPEVTPFDIDEPQVTYTGTTEGGDPYNSSEMPTEKGSYEITVKVDDKSVSWEFEIDTKLDENGDPVMDDGKEVLEVIPKYHWVYPGYGIDYNNGHLWYTQAQYNAGSDADKAVFNKKNDDGTEYLYNFVAIDDEKAARKELINRPESSDGSAVPADLYIDMFTEHLSVPAGKKVASYCLTKGGKWVNGELTDEIIQKAFGKSETLIAISYTELSDTKQKKPSGTIYTFVKVDKRPACTPLKVNYAVCSDKTGRTPGQFILTDSDGKYMYNCSNKFDITFASKDEAKNPATVGWGVWPSTGGVWVPEILKDDNGKLKAGKVVIYVRTTAKKSSSGTKFTPSSKVKKLSVSTSQKATSVKADYKKEAIKLKKNVVAYFGTEILDITKVDFYALTKDYGTEIYAVTPEAVSGSAAEPMMVTFETLANKYPEELSFDDYEDMIVDYDEDVSSNPDLKKKGIDLRGYLTTARNSVLAWTKATDKKPASITSAIKLAKRGIIDKSIESLVVIDDKGKAGIAKLGPDKKVNLEIKVTDKKGKVSWKTSIPMAAKTELVTAAGVDYQIAESIYEIRVKYDAKGGKEDDTSNAAGVSRFVLVTFKNIGTGRSVKVGVEKVEFFDTEDQAKAAKKIVEPAPEPEPTT